MWCRAGDGPQSGEGHAGTQPVRPSPTLILSSPSAHGMVLPAFKSGWIFLLVNYQKILTDTPEHVLHQSSE